MQQSNEKTVIEKSENWVMKMQRCQCEVNFDALTNNTV